MASPKKTLLKEIKPYVELHRCPRTGVAWVEDGTSGNCYSAHPNIDATGSVAGMKKLGYWRKDAETIRTNGTIYNVSELSVSNPYDQIAAEACRCGYGHSG